MSNGSMRFDQPTPIGLALAQLIQAAGKDPNQVFAVFDVMDALAMAQPKPAMHGERLIVVFQDFTVMNVDIDGSGLPRC